MELSERLAAVAGMVRPGETAADIGTDHGYLPIYLVQSGISHSAVATDINDGPVKRAKENIRKYGLSDKIRVRKGDGLAPLKAGEADVAVLSGMGGLLIIKILDEAKETARKMRLILSPQSDLFKVREYLLDNGFGIFAETMVKEDGKYYVIMSAGAADEKEAWSYTEKCFGKYLIRSGSSVVAEYLAARAATLRDILEKLTLAGTDGAKEKIPEIKKELAAAEGALAKAGRDKNGGDKNDFMQRDSRMV